MAVPTYVHVERVGTRTYIGRNERGGAVRIGAGDGEGVFSPGELLHVALAACGILSADGVLARRLGDDYLAVVDVSATKPQGEDRYDFIAATIRANLGDLESDATARLIESVARAIERACTVGHSLDQGVPHQFTLVNDAGVLSRA